MSLAQPWALALLALAVPIVLLYILRGNPRRRPTTAVFLWRDLQQQVTARRRWRHPPRSLALVLQLLALCAGVLALVGPAFGHTSTRQFAYLLDASASMQATDILPNRFEAARAAIRREVQQLRPGDRATLIRIGAQSQALAAGSDRTELLRALDAAQPGAAPPNLRDALALAGQRLEAPIAEGSEIIVFSDGTLPDPLGLGALRAPVRFEKIGRRGANQGISTLEVKRAPGESARLAGFASLTNYGDASTRLPVRILADGLLLETRQVELPSRGRAEVPFEVPQGARSVAVALGGRDDLALDDRAEITVPENRRRSVLLVSRSPEAWEQALGVIPGLDLTTQAPASFRDVGADLVVLDGFLPPTLPGGQVLVVNPPPGNTLVGVLGDQREVPISSYDARQPLLRSLDLGALRLVRAQRLAVPGWASPVAEAPGGPVLLQGELGGRRIVVMGFDPLVSGLEKLVTFPILVANVVEFLGSSGSDPWVAPGLSVTLPLARDAVEVVLERPDGTQRRMPGDRGAILIDSTEQVGRYTLRQRLASGETLARSFYVNLFGEKEADTAPRERSAWPAASAPSSEVRLDAPVVWWPLALGALLLLTLEWLHFLWRS